MQNDEIRKAYSDHLGQFAWDTFLTVTFRHTRHDGTNAVHSVWERLPLAPLRGFFAVERHKLDGIHLHALLYHSPQVFDTEAFNLIPGRTQAYCTKTFGWSKAEFIKSEFALEYCAKYVTKDNDYFYQGLPFFWRKLT